MNGLLLASLAYFHVSSATSSAVIPAQLTPAPTTANVTVQKPAKQVEPQQASAEVEADDPETPPEERICSLNAVDWDLAKMTSILSEQTGANLVLLSNASSKLTVRLANVKLGEMLMHLCALSGLKALKVGQTFVLATPEKLKSGYPTEYAKAFGEEVATPEPPALEVEVVQLRYLRGTEAISFIEKFFAKSDLVVEAAPSMITPGLSRAETSATTGVQAGTLTESGSETGNGSKLLILRGPRQRLEEARRLLEAIDLARPQVVIEVTIHDINEDALKEMGMSWSLGNLAISESSPNKLNFGTFTRVPQAFSAAIKALEQQNRAKLLASPNISVLEGEKAFILIGDRLVFPVLVGYTQANTPIFSREEERVGIYLQVSAQVSSDGQVTLVLYPQVSTVTGFLEVNGASYPQISTREAQTTLRVPSGQTIVMGGLLKDEEIVQLERVPIISQIPLIGELFTRRKRTKVSSQVIISITPTILKSED